MARVAATNRVASTDRFLQRDFGTCISFDGVDDTMTCGNLGNLMTSLEGGGGFSFSLWMKTSQKTKTNFMGGANIGTVTVLTFTINKNSSDSLAVNKIGIFVRDDDNSFQNLATTNAYNYTNGEWHHFVLQGIPTANTWEIWIDGTSQALTLGSITGTIDNFTDFSSGFRLGSSVSSASGLASSFTKVSTDLLLAHQRMLTSDEIRKLYYEGVIPVTQLAYYKFDEGSGTSATDFSGNNHTGTITGATYSNDVFQKPRTIIG